MALNWFNLHLPMASFFRQKKSEYCQVIPLATPVKLNKIKLPQEVERSKIYIVFLSEVYQMYYQSPVKIILLYKGKPLGDFCSSFLLILLKAKKGSVLPHIWTLDFTVEIRGKMTKIPMKIWLFHQFNVKPPCYQTSWLCMTTLCPKRKPVVPSLFNKLDKQFNLTS